MLVNCLNLFLLPSSKCVSIGFYQEFFSPQEHWLSHRLSWGTLYLGVCRGSGGTLCLGVCRGYCGHSVFGGVQRLLGAPCVWGCAGVTGGPLCLGVCRGS